MIVMSVASSSRLPQPSRVGDFCVDANGARDEPGCKGDHGRKLIAAIQTEMMADE